MGIFSLSNSTTSNTAILNANNHTSFSQYDASSLPLVVKDGSSTYNGKSNAFSHMDPEFFKKVLGAPEHGEALLSFLNGLFKEHSVYEGNVFPNGKSKAPMQLISAELATVEHHILPQGDKLSPIDMRALMNDGTQVNIQLLMINDNDELNYLKYYYSDIIESYYRLPNYDDNNLPYSVQLIISNVVVYPGDDLLVSPFAIMKVGSNVMLDDLIVKYYMELPKLNAANLDNLSKTEAFALYFKSNSYNTPWDVLGAVDPSFNKLRETEEKLVRK